jgi:hypothetical protein
VFIAGASGCGKTTTMLRLALDDIENGRSVVLVDPHGDVAEQLARVAPKDRLQHVDPRLARTAPLDLLDPDPDRAAAHLLSAVGEVWPAEFSGPVWHRAISLACRGVTASEHIRRPMTLADVSRFFTDESWRERILRGIDEGSLKDELVREHAAWKQGPRDDHSVIGWVSSKFAPLVNGPGSAIFSTPTRRSLDADIAAGQVIVVSLPIGTFGSATSSLAARMFLTRLTSAIARQGDVPPERRRPVSVILDEAHIMKGFALAGLFAQARKFNCSVTVACQAPSQLEPHLDEVLTNAQTHLLGRLPRREAGRVVERVGEDGARALTRLPRHHLVLALEENDPDSAPIVLTPVAPPNIPAASPEERATAAAPDGPRRNTGTEPTHQEGTDHEPRSLKATLEELLPIKHV